MFNWNFLVFPLFWGRRSCSLSHCIIDHRSLFFFFIQCVMNKFYLIISVVVLRQVLVHYCSWPLYSIRRVYKVVKEILAEFQLFIQLSLLLLLPHRDGFWVCGPLWATVLRGPFLMPTMNNIQNQTPCYLFEGPLSHVRNGLQTPWLMMEGPY